MRRKNILIVVLSAIILVSCSKNVPSPAPPSSDGDDIPKVEDMILDPAEWKEKYLCAGGCH